MLGDGVAVNGGVVGDGKGDGVALMSGISVKGGAEGNAAAGRNNVVDGNAVAGWRVGTDGATLAHAVMKILQRIIAPSLFISIPGSCAQIGERVWR
jgi:hypothetical protein